MVYHKLSYVWNKSAKTSADIRTSEMKEQRNQGQNKSQAAKPNTVSTTGVIKRPPSSRNAAQTKSPQLNTIQPQ